MVDRAPRDMETREHAARPAPWRPPSTLPDPNPIPGYKFRWVRISATNAADNMNMSAKLRQGWEPVKAADHPELKLYADKNARFPDGVEVGGLVLCKIPTETVDQRNAYYAKVAQAQMDSVDQNYMRENDPRMPLLSPDRKSRTTFGSGRSST